MRNRALFLRVALFSLSLAGVQLRQAGALPREPTVLGIAYTVDSTGDGHNVGPVTQCNDGTGHCTLRAAIEAANGHAGDDGIFFNIPIAGNNCDASGNCTIHLGTALQDLSDNVAISGPGMDKLIVIRNSTSSFRIFNVTAPGVVSLSGMTITNGSAPTNGTGGGINQTSAGTVNVINCTVSSNQALVSGAGGGINNDSSGTLNITNSTVSANSAGEGGGIRSNGGTVNVTGSTVSGNTADSNSGAFSGTGHGAGILLIAGTLNVTNSTLSGNLARDTGGGGNTINGGGIYVAAGTANVINSTLSGNSANKDGGGIYNTATLKVSNCTLTGNSAIIGGGIYNQAAGSATLKSSLVALNMSITHNFNGSFVTGGFNLIGSNDGAGASFPPGNPNANNDIVGTNAAPIDPKIDAGGLKDNGGPTKTIALLAGSPAIDKGSNVALPNTPLSTDQRGDGFPRTSDDPAIANAAIGTDIGAFELPAPTPPPTPTPAPTPTATPTPTASPGLVANVSTRLPVGTGDNVLIEGFVVQGPAGSTKKIIVRAIGPALAAFGITDALPNPTLEIHDANNNNAIVATNDDWRNTQLGGLITADQSSEISASGFAPGNDLESAIIANLPPGSYTAVVRGVGNSVGTGVVDAYDLSTTSSASLVNVATRGLIQPGDGLMIGGFITENGLVKAVVRAIGPSLAAFGITNALADTTLQLRDGNGNLVVENDDWKIRSSDGGSQQAEIEATGLQPSDDREAAVVTTLPPGQYTAQVRGKPETTGTGVVQIYFLP
jgi:CSLREA domain-containing protein